MIRNTASQFRGQSASDYNNGAALNRDLCLDVRIRRGAEQYYGYDRWVAGHRNGETGLNNPNTPDIQLFKVRAESMICGLFIFIRYNHTAGCRVDQTATAEQLGIPDR